MDSGIYRGGDKDMVRAPELIESYLAGLKSVKADDIEIIADMLSDAARVFVAGNGGSAATAIHFASDLRSAGVDATSLCDNIAVFSRLANDKSYEDVFASQITDIGEGHALVLISASGRSPNIIKAAVSVPYYVPVIGLIGCGGGVLGRMAKHSIIVDSHDFGVIEGVHDCVCHMIASLVKEMKCPSS